MKWSAALPFLLFSVSCGPGQPGYLDRAKVLNDDQVAPQVTELIPILTRGDREPDELIRTWKEYLEDTSFPLRHGEAFTFVYYDFTHTLGQVSLQTSFIPERQEPLNRVGTTAFYWKTYAIPRPKDVTYRFVHGNQVLPDPFHPSHLPGTEFWQPLLTTLTTDTEYQSVVGASENRLAGLDVELLLPPGFRRNLAWTYPVVIAVGSEGKRVLEMAEGLQKDEKIRPILVAVPQAPGSLKPALEERLLPWLRESRRASELPTDLVLMGRPEMAKEIQELVALRPDLWSRTWVGPEAQIEAYLVSQWPVVNP